MDIPYVAQPKGSNMCGAACVAMILKYKKISYNSLESIWNEVSGISPETGRKYCQTVKVGGYLAKTGLKSCVVRYKNLRDFLQVCTQNNVIVILNHRSYENNLGHFSVVKGLSGSSAFINDPAKKTRDRVSINNLEEKSQKSSSYDEVGGSVAVISLDFEGNENIECPVCNSDVDVSLAKKISSQSDILESVFCLNCDAQISI